MESHVVCSDHVVGSCCNFGNCQCEVNGVTYKDPAARAPCDDHVALCSDPGSGSRVPSIPPKPPPQLSHHGQHEEERASPAPPSLRGGAPTDVDQGRTASEAARIVRDGRGADRGDQEDQDPTSGGHRRPESCKPEEGHPHRLCQEHVRRGGDQLRHHCHDPEEGDDLPARDGGGLRSGRDGVRQVRGEELCPSHDRGSAVLRMGDHDSGRRTQLNLPEALRQVGGQEAEVRPHPQGHLREQPEARFPQEGASGQHQEDGGPASHRLHEGTANTGSEFLGYGRAGVDQAGPGPGCRDQGLEGGAQHSDSPEDRREERRAHGEALGQPLSYAASQVLEHKSQQLIPNMFEELIGSSRLEFMEVACEPNSLLTKTFQDRNGRSDAACRSSLWCGHDLSTKEGLLLVLEQIHTMRPKRVWISPPCGPYSPLQNINQRSPSQVRELKAKRVVACRIYDSTLEIVKTCLQLGIHVAVELAEKCEAWRLPIFQKLRFDLGLFTGVTKGCSVGLKGQDGRLLQKGWRIVTSHRWLAEKLHKPCRCPTSYQHAKCEGSNTAKTAMYTKEFARLVYEAFCKEGSSAHVIAECSGKSEVPGGFGLGAMCTCQEHDQPCGACLLQDTCLEVEVPAEAFTCQDVTATLEQQAKENQACPKHRTLQDLENLLRRNPLPKIGKSRRDPQNPGDYQVFGSYAYGNQYHVTRRTTCLPNFCKYVNEVLRSFMPKDMTWTSFVVNRGVHMPIHRDSNNDAKYPNGSIGLGSFEGGGLWIEGSGSLCGRQGLRSTRENGQGEVLEGMEFDIKGRPVLFSPKAWHGSCGWKGDRWVITVFVSRNWDLVSDSELDVLRSLGFPTPKRDKPKVYLGACSKETHETPGSAPEEAYVGVQAPGPQASQLERERIKKQLYLLHCATGHCSPKHLEQALKKRGADELTLQLAREFECPACQEKSKPLPRNLASLEPLPPKLSTISADVGHWVHPHSQESVQFMLVIDEGSRFRTARVLTEGSRQSPNAQMCLHYLQEGWVQYFGLPRCLRLDPAGAFRSTAVEDWCDKHGIFLDIVPGEAHWKIGTCENAVKGVKNVMDKLSAYDETLSAREALAEAVAAFNHKEIIRGFSPSQHILGQAPDETGRFLAASQHLPPDLLVEHPKGEFERSVRLRAEAEKAQSEWSANQRILRAHNSRHRPCYNYRPGELVFYWRTQEANKSRRQPGGKHGRFLGPARILATESRTSPDGSIRPGGSVWLVKGRSLLKAAPEQLRRATQREELLEAMAGPSEQQAPWTFHAVAAQIGGNRFEDITTELPDEAEWRRAQQRKRCNLAASASVQSDQQNDLWNH